MMNIFIIDILHVSQCSSTYVLFEKEKTTKKKKKIKVSKKKQPDHCREDFYSDDDFVEWCAPCRQDAAAPAPAPPASQPPNLPQPSRMLPAPCQGWKEDKLSPTFGPCCPSSPLALSMERGSVMPGREWCLLPGSPARSIKLWGWRTR